MRVLLSDYAKLRSIARERNVTPMEVLRETLCAGVRRLAGISTAALVALVLAVPAQAAAGESSGRPVRERQIGLFGAAKMAAYKAQSAARANLAEDCRALARMVEESDGRYVEVCAELERKYGMTLSENYHYSEEDLTLYLVVTNGLFGSSPENPVMRAHRAFVSEEDARGFVATVASRSAAAEDAATLRRFLAEKREGLSAADAALREKFGVVAGKEYRLDEETGMFFEVLPMPTEAELKAQREAEERAVREAKERARYEAEARARAEKEAKAAKEKARREAEERKAAEARAEKERRAAEAKAEKVRKEAEEKARKEAEARAKAERKAAREAEEKARREAEARAKAERKAAREAEEKARKEAEARAKAERKAAREAEEKARKEAEARAKAERKATREAEERAKAAARAKERDEKLYRDAERDIKKGSSWF